ALAEQIKQHAQAWAVVSISPDEIDRINILQATMLAMKTSVERLKIVPDHVFIDGNRCPEISHTVTAIIKGDARVAEISAASILAKVERDAQMAALHEQYPHYGFDKHKGYPTKAHMESLAEHGPCPEHRRSYAPVRRCLEKDN
ncbi:MAG: ribonuclease HII, partial [Gammaproteobacteria bacterium]|nr:ribonuclease HII [Gammaproteobacteria bacterium]